MLHELGGYPRSDPATGEAGVNSAELGMEVA